MDRCSLIPTLQRLPERCDEFDVGPIADTDGADNRVTEFAPTGSVVGITAAAVDEDGTDSVRYDLVDNAGGRFAIDPASGVVRVADGSLLDYRRANSHSVMVQATSTDASFRLQQMAIAVIGTAPRIIASSEAVYVDSTKPTTNLGSSQSINARSGNRNTQNSYLKFEVTELNGLTVASATLRLYAIRKNDDGGAIFTVSNELANDRLPWTDDNLTWENAPAIDTPALSAVGAVRSGVWVEIDVTAAIQGEGVYSFALRGKNSKLVGYNSNDAAENQPVLVIATTQP